jgi:integrase
MDDCCRAREKVNDGKLKLPKFTLAIVEAQPRIRDNPFVFAGRGKKAFNSFSDGKEDLGQKVQISPWVIHDLRRTARSLMSRAGVRSEIAERALGHVIPGVEGVYNRYAYLEEKGEALAAISNLVKSILAGGDSNVVPIKAAKART